MHLNCCTVIHVGKCEQPQPGGFLLLLFKCDWHPAYGALLAPSGWEVLTSIKLTKTGYVTEKPLNISFKKKSAVCQSWWCLRLPTPVLTWLPPKSFFYFNLHLTHEKNNNLPNKQWNTLKQTISNCWDYSDISSFKLFSTCSMTDEENAKNNNNNNH